MSKKKITITTTSKEEILFDDLTPREKAIYEYVKENHIDYRLMAMGFLLGMLAMIILFQIGWVKN